MGTPATLPADFFDKQAGGKAPDELPSDFFDKPKVSGSEKTGLPGIAKPKLEMKKVASPERAAKLFMDPYAESAVKPQDIDSGLSYDVAMSAVPFAESAGFALAGIGKRAVGLAAGLGTGFAVDKAARALGAPPWLAEILAVGGGAAVGGKLSPESAAKIQDTLKGGGIKGLLNSWINGTKEDEALAFFKEVHGEAAITAKQKLQARAEAAAFKRQVAEQLKPKLQPKVKPEKPPMSNSQVPEQSAQKPDLLKKEMFPERKPAAPPPSGTYDPNAMLPRPAPKLTPKPAPQAAVTRETPVQSLDPRNIGWSRLEAQAKAKDLKMAQSFKDQGVTLDQLEAMPEEELNKHLKANKFEPFRGKNLSRSFAAGKADIIKAYKKLNSIP